MGMPTEGADLTRREAMREGGIDAARWSWAIILLAVLPADLRAQPPQAAAVQPEVCNRRGLLHRMFHHTAHTLEDTLIGYPQTFVEPPLGAYINRQFTIQVAKADPHRFTLYRSDFLPGTDRFSPIGASRFNLMFGRLGAWFGPVVVEWTPDQPALAQARRRAVLATLEKAGRPILAERVVIGPSPYPGAIGDEAGNNFTNTLLRSRGAAPAFALPPAESAAFGVR
jgi:hypothetical protein